MRSSKVLVFRYRIEIGSDFSAMLLISSTIDDLLKIPARKSKLLVIYTLLSYEKSTRCRCSDNTIINFDSRAYLHKSVISVSLDEVLSNRSCEEVLIITFREIAPMISF